MARHPPFPEKQTNKRSAKEMFFFDFISQFDAFNVSFVIIPHTNVNWLKQYKT